jgi:predicted GNAT family acetyltransferase
VRYIPKNNNNAMNSYKAIHKPESNRFEIHEGGRIAYVEYRLHDGAIDITHTIVPIALENKGIGSALVQTAYDWGHTERLSPKATCSFAVAWLRRHPINE